MKKTPKKNSFKTPPGYFEGLSDRIQERMQADAPGKFPETEGFKVPDGYFEQVQKDILAKSRNEDTPVITMRSYKNYFYAAAAIAAVFVLVFGLRWNRPQTISFDELADMDITSYFESRELDLSSYEIAEVVPVSDLDIEDFMDGGVEDAQIMDYLEDSIDDLEELNIDLNEEFQ
jgi:hypothetical protein